jgi:polyhydroxyalkanoate synthase
MTPSAASKASTKQTEKKVNFFTRQYIDALSPSNFALTNPEVLPRDGQEPRPEPAQGPSTTCCATSRKGDGQLRVKMTDTSAFEMGKNVATTPGKVVFQNEMIQLIQYSPTPRNSTRSPADRPAVDQQVLHPRPAREELLVKWATDQGHTTFVISWVNPDEKLAEKSFEDYLLEGSLGHRRQVCQQTGEKEVNLIGYCLGGTLLGLTLAYMAAKKDKRVASATFFTTMLDFSEPGELGVFIDEARSPASKRRWPSAATSKARKWPAPSTCCAPTT